MSRLYFTPVDKAFTLGSSQIKDTQEEIEQLTKLILDSNSQTAKKKAPQTPLQNPPQNQSQTPFEGYKRIGYPDQQMAMFRPNTAQDDVDYNLMKVIGHPKFDDIVRNYALIKHPEWLLKETVYVPQYVQQPSSKSNFGGNQYQSTVCSEVQKYLMFFIISVVFFTLLTLYF
jgi:hypothetical protein